MFKAALFTIAKIRKPIKCPSTDEWIKKMLGRVVWDFEGKEGNLQGDGKPNAC